MPDEITVLYARLSSEDKDKERKGDDSNSIVNQKKLLAKHANKKCLINPVFFIDDDYVGSNFDRPDFQAALELAKEGRVVNFVVKDMKRFGRDYIRVGFFTEYTLTELDVRFIAIHENVDTAVRPISEETALPFLNVANELHLRDLSRNLRSVFRGKGEEGEPLAPTPPYGYRKDPDNKKRWIIDEPAAKVVRQMFQWCMEGLGPTHIANRLRDEQVEMPTVYAANAGIRKSRKDVLDPYDWPTATVVKILERREYLGHVVNFKTFSKSYKHKKRYANDPSALVVFENKHSPIIEEAVFERVQQLRNNKRRPRHSGRENILAGLVFCADCGSKMTLSSGASQKPEEDYYACTGFRTKKKSCISSHYIRRIILEQMVLDSIQRVTTFAAKHEKLLVERLEARDTVKLASEMAEDKKRLAKSEKRILELDEILAKTFEKNAMGVLSDELFIKLSRRYEQEQKDLKTGIEALRAQIVQQLEASTGISRFIAKVRKYTDVTELTSVMLNELVERVDVYARDKNYSKGVQAIVIHFSSVGPIDEADLQPPPARKRTEAERKFSPPEVIQRENIPVISAINS